MARNDGGFSLVEALVAMAILSMVVLGFLGMRTTALIHASEARNTRLAREIADRVMSELKAGAREMPPESGVEVQIENLPGFSYRFVIGEAQIAEFEGQRSADFAMAEADRERSDRLEWQREREDLRAARRDGRSLMEYRESRALSESTEEKLPSETELEDVLLIVDYPDARGLAENTGSGVLSLQIRARLSTMAIQGLTPDEAESVAKARGDSGTGGATPANSGGTTNSGGGASGAEGSGR
jgi:prepilin-type N-terminal cleavage/methylation domain-containing protein